MERTVTFEITHAELLETAKTIDSLLRQDSFYRPIEIQAKLIEAMEEILEIIMQRSQMLYSEIGVYTLE